MKVQYRRRLASAALAVFVSACAPLPTEPTAENLDPDTGTTVAVTSRPVELVAEKRRGVSRDVFAYVAPFETNRMGDKALYLWISAPEDKGKLAEPELQCDGQPLALEPLTQSLEDLGLSRPPYPKPAPWSGQWYYHLTGEALQCLGKAARVAVVVTRAEGKKITDTFSAEGPDLAVLGAFAAER